MVGRALPLVLVIVALLAGCTQPYAARPPSGPDAPLLGDHLRFSPWSLIDSQTDGREPSLAIDGDGRLFVSAPTAGFAAPYVSRLWMSSDSGSTWKRIDPNAPLLPQGRGLGGGDSSVAVGRDGAIYVSDLWGGSSTVSASHDHGGSWKTTPLSSTVPYYDREWNAVDAKGRAYVLARNYFPGSAAWVSRSDDGGQTWLTVGAAWTMNASMPPAPYDGNLVVDPRTDSLHEGYICGSEGTDLCVATSRDAGATWTHVVAARREVRHDDDLPALAVDDGGHLYLVWSESLNGTTDLLFSRSVDGMDWTPPLPIDPRPGARVLPWVIAGAPGRVAVAWYASERAGNPGDAAAMANATWNVYVAQTLDGLDGGPKWDVVRASDRPVHFGPVSRGVGTEGTPDRSLGDILAIAKDPAGNLKVAFTVGTRGNVTSHIGYAAQAGGPTMF